MQTITAQDGDTWEAIADANGVPLTSLLRANGLDPNASNEPPDAGSTVAIPDPPPDVCIAPGEDHAVDCAPESVLWVRVDMPPPQAAYTLDSLRLYSDDGSHDVTLRIAASFVPNEGSVDVLFDAIDPRLSYSIDYQTAGGDIVPIASSAPFESFVDDALPDPDPPLEVAADDDGMGDRSLPPMDPAVVPFANT